GGGGNFNHKHDRPNATGVRVRLREEFARHHSDHAAVIRCGTQRLRGNQKSEEAGQRSKETTDYLGRKHTDCDRTKIAISKQKLIRPGSVCILALDNEICFCCWLHKFPLVSCFEMRSHYDQIQKSFLQLLARMAI